MVLPILAGGAAAGGAYWLMNQLSGKDKVDPYKPNKEAFQYQGTGEGEFQKRGDMAQQRTAPQADYGKYEGGRAQQMEGRADQGLASSYYKSMINNPNSMAQQQLRQASDANFRQQMAAGRSAGYNPAAMRSAMQTGGQINAQTNQQAQGLQLQETNMAIQGLAQTAMQQRAQDLQLMGMDAQTAQYQAMLELQQGALNDKMQLGMYGLGQNASLAELQAAMGYEGMYGSNVMAAQGANVQADSAENAALWGMVGTGMTAGAQYGAKPPPPSDEASKQKIQEVESENSVLRDLMATLGLAPAKVERQQVQKAPEYKGQYRYPEARDAADIADAERKFRMQNREALGQQAMEEIRRKQLAETYQQDVEQQRGFEESYYDPQAEAVLRGEHPGFVAPRPGERGVPQPIVAPPSDERSKDRIAELEGIVSEYQRMTGGLGESKAPRPDLRQFGNTARYADPSSEPPPFEPDEPRSQGPLKRPIWDIGAALGGKPRDEMSFETDYEPEPGTQASARRFADIPAKSWEYEEPFATQYPGRHVGPTAQDLEANPATSGTVYTGSDGLKRPDPTLLSLSNTAAISEMARIQQDQEERIRAYEQMSQGRALSEDQMRRLR